MEPLLKSYFQPLVRSGAEARVLFVAFLARLKPCRFKTSAYSLAPRTRG
jgi:hypothetical protein